MGGDTIAFGGLQIISNSHIPSDTAIISDSYIGNKVVLVDLVTKKIRSGDIKIRGYEASQVWFDDYAETEDNLGYLRSEALKAMRKEQVLDELEATPGFGSF